MYLITDASSPSKGWPLALGYLLQGEPPDPHFPRPLLSLVYTVLLACVLLWLSQSLHTPELKTGVLYQANTLQARMQHCAVSQFPHGLDI